MKIITLLIILLSFQTFTYSQKCSDKWNIHRSLKARCLEKIEKSHKYLGEVKWVKDSSENQEQFFKVLFAEEYLGDIGELTPEAISEIDSIKEVVDYKNRMSRIRSNYDLLGDKHDKYQKKYCIDRSDLTKTDSLILVREKELIREQEIKDSLELAEQNRLVMLEQARLDSIQRAKQDSINFANGEKAIQTIVFGSVDVINGAKNSPYVTKIQEESKNKAYIRAEVVLTDSTIAYDFEVSVYGKGFDRGVYYNENSYLYLRTQFDRILTEHSGKNMVFHVSGKADALKEGVSYPKRYKSYGEVREENVSVTRVGFSDSVTTIEDMYLPSEGNLSGAQLAFARMYMCYQITQEMAGRKPDKIFIKDYLESSDNKGVEYRTSGFTIVVSYDELQSFTLEQLEEVGLGKGSNFKYAIETDENGDLKAVEIR